MTSGNDELGERQLREQRALDQSIARRAKVARRQYEKILARLWLGNAGGAVVTVSYFGAAGAARNLTPKAIYFFLIGLLILGLGTLLDLVREWMVIYANQRATHSLGLKAGYGKSPVERAGFSTSAILAGFAALCFVGGCIVGLVELPGQIDSAMLPLMLHTP